MGLLVVRVSLAMLSSVPDPLCNNAYALWARLMRFASEELSVGGAVYFHVEPSPALYVMESPCWKVRVGKSVPSSSSKCLISSALPYSLALRFSLSHTRLSM